MALLAEVVDGNGVASDGLCDVDGGDSDSDTDAVKDVQSHAVLRDIVTLLNRRVRAVQEAQQQLRQKELALVAERRFNHERADAIVAREVARRQHALTTAVQDHVREMERLKQENEAYAENRVQEGIRISLLAEQTARSREKTELQATISDLQRELSIAKENEILLRRKWEQKEATHHQLEDVMALRESSVRDHLDEVEARERVVEQAMDSLRAEREAFAQERVQIWNSVADSAGGRVDEWFEHCSAAVNKALAEACHRMDPLAEQLSLSTGAAVEKHIGKMEEACTRMGVRVTEQMKAMVDTSV